MTPGALSETRHEDADLVDLQEVAGFTAWALAVRKWERERLPVAGTRLGVEVFLQLGWTASSGDRDQASFLKRLYLDLPYSEKGIRLHLRRLEADGWLVTSKTRGARDSRASQVELTEKYWRLLRDYMKLLKI